MFPAGILIRNSLYELISPAFNVPDIVKLLKSNWPIVLEETVPMVEIVNNVALVPVKEHDAAPVASE